MGSERALPVFVQPQELHVVITNPSSYRQLLTVLNPFDFVLSYRVLSNAPHKFKLQESTGFVKPKCFVDIVVRHLSPTESRDNDALRVEFYREGENTCCGKKDVPVIVSNSETIRNTNRTFQNFPDSHSHQRQEQRARQQPRRRNLETLFLITGLIAVVVLLLPAHNSCNSTSSSFIPQYLHPSPNLQLVAAYALGLITLGFFRQINDDRER